MVPGFRTDDVENDPSTDTCVPWTKTVAQSRLIPFEVQPLVEEVPQQPLVEELDLECQLFQLAACR